MKATTKIVKITNNVSPGKPVPVGTIPIGDLFTLPSNLTVIYCIVQHEGGNESPMSGVYRCVDLGRLCGMSTFGPEDLAIHIKNAVLTITLDGDLG